MDSVFLDMQEQFVFSKWLAWWRKYMEDTKETQKQSMMFITGIYPWGRSIDPLSMRETRHTEATKFQTKVHKSDEFHEPLSVVPENYLQHKQSEKQTTVSIKVTSTEEDKEAQKW